MQAANLFIFDRIKFLFQIQLIVMILVAICRPIHSGFFKLSTRKNSSYSIRIAHKNDIPFIRNCNVANLPENYNDNFYNQQLKDWPNLSLVCQDKEENIVGYALGRVLQSTDPYAMEIPTLPRGHIASIAVSKAHRGNKLAHDMMTLMHRQFSLQYTIDEIDLFCRVSL